MASCRGFSYILILDLGCGRLKFKNAIGIDVDPYSSADIIADVYYLPIKSEAASMVVSRQLIEHISTIHFMKEINRVLCKNGVVWLETPNALYFMKVLWALQGRKHNPYIEHIQTFSAPELENLCRQARLTVLKIEFLKRQEGGKHFLVRRVKELLASFCHAFCPMFDRDVKVIAVKK